MLKTFGERASKIIDTTEVARKMHAKDLARATGIGSRRITSILSGKVETTIYEADSIATALDVPVGYLINGGVEEDPVDTAQSAETVCGSGNNLDERTEVQQLNDSEVAAGIKGRSGEELR